MDCVIISKVHMALPDWVEFHKPEGVPSRQNRLSESIEITFICAAASRGQKSSYLVLKPGFYPAAICMRPQPRFCSPQPLFQLVLLDPGEETVMWILAGFHGGFTWTLYARGVGE